MVLPQQTRDEAEMPDGAVVKEAPHEDSSRHRHNSQRQGSPRKRRREGWVVV